MSKGELTISGTALPVHPEAGALESAFRGIQQAEAAARRSGETLMEDVLTQPRVKVSSGAGAPVLNYGDEALKTIDGIIVARLMTRAYWSESLEGSGGGKSPDCSSNDSVTGRGDPTGRGEVGSHQCSSCPNAQWGSGRGQGQACKRIDVLVVFAPDVSAIPIPVQIPVTSIPAVKSYIRSLARQPGGPYYPWQVVTRIGVEKAQSKGGNDYYAYRFEPVQATPPDLVSALDDLNMSVTQDVAEFEGSVADTAPARPSDARGSSEIDEDDIGE